MQSSTVFEVPIERPTKTPRGLAYAKEDSDGYRKDRITQRTDNDEHVTHGDTTTLALR